MTLSSSLFMRHAVLSRHCRFCWVLPVLMFLGAVAPLQTAAAEAEKPHKPQPLFKMRELYAVGHFNNTYEVMGDNRVPRASWRRQSPGDSTATPTGSTLTIAKTRSSAHIRMDSARPSGTPRRPTTPSRKLGLLCSLTSCPNNVYITQCLPGLLATGGEPHPGPVDLPVDPAGAGDDPEGPRKPLRRSGPIGRATQ